MLRGVEQAGQGTVIQLQLVGIDQSIQVTQGLGIAFVLVKRGGARKLDATADQPGEDGWVAHAPCSRSNSAKWLRARR
ncbi:hypothetical protein D3C71_1812590 [compost metagenome]